MRSLAILAFSFLIGCGGAQGGGDVDAMRSADLSSADRTPTDEGTMPTDLADPCVPGQCGPNGTCVDTNGVAACACTGHYGGPTCAVCATGYAGAGCTTCAAGYVEFPAGSGTCIADACQPDPCNGRGSCDDSTGAAQCTCNTGYGGPTCATCAAGYYQHPLASGVCIVDPCVPDPCDGHGTCANGTGAAVCTCSSHFTGVDCSSCAVGYTGAACGACDVGFYEHPSGTCIDDPCQPDPCDGLGTCANDTGAAVCTCSGHYGGPTCSTCATGYTGAGCTACDAGYYEYPPGSGTCIDDPCAPDPCNGHGSCANTTGVAVCTCSGNWAAPTCVACVDGYDGTDCQNNIDDCASAPCKNAGTCTDGIASYTCTCKGAWGGTTCTDLYYGPAANQNEARLADTIANCNEQNFLDLSDWLPDPNTAYTDPTLGISCTSTTMVVSSNSVPQYKITWSDASRTSYANTLVPTTSTYTFPRTPSFNATPKVSTVVGGVGVAINGVQISSPSASGGVLEYADPAYIEVDGDVCEGHPNPTGKYHYHALVPRCFYPDAQNGDLRGDACTAPSPIIGYIADGYPMLGPCECLDAACTQVVEMRSSWKLEGGDNDPSACAFQDYTYVGDANEESDGDKYLDQCNGHYGPAGDYHYHMTNEYPWTTRCYRGNPMAQATMGHTYDSSAGKNDCCFEKECIDGVHQNVSCTMSSCM